MRRAHRYSPFHRIECWTGLYFRRAALWEVGTYILVEHHTEISICDGLKFQMEFLERFQDKKDQDEQDMVSKMQASLALASASAEGGGEVLQDEEIYETWEDEIMGDAKFFDWLNTHHQNRSEVLDDGSRNDLVADQESENDDNADADVDGISDYLELSNRTPGCFPDAGADAGRSEMDGTGTSRPRVDALNNTYVRVLHTNGIHHLAMVTCLC